MKVGPMFKHFGSKWSGAKHYPYPLNGLPIFEPYAGGAGYSLNHCDHPVTIWDEDKHLQTLWRWLIEEASESLIRDIPINLAEGTDIRKLGLSAGQATLLKHWQRTNNCGDCWTISPWGNKPGQWTANTRARVAEQVHAIKHWKFGIVHWTKAGTYFVDPPYLYNYRYRFGADSMNFEELAKKCRALPRHSLLIACEATCPKTGAIPDWLPFVESHKQVTSRRKETNNHHSKELVYIEHYTH